MVSLHANPNLLLLSLLSLYNTPPPAPTGPPLNVTSDSLSPTSIRISWQAPLLSLQNGNITSYRITVKELETEKLLTFSIVPTDSIYVVYFLHPLYNYNCSVAAYTIGLGPSAYILGQTLPEGTFT